MKRVTLVRTALSFLMLLSFVCACLPQLRATAQDQRVVKERQVREPDSKTRDPQEFKAKEPKSKEGKGKIKALICNDCPAPVDDGDGGGAGGGGGGVGGGGGGYTGDGHIWCDGWDRQGDCVFNHVDATTSAEFRRQLGTNGYDWQSFLSWFPQDSDGFGRMPIHDGNVGLISTQPLPGQVALHRWSTQKGFKYSIYYAQYGGDYVYGGIAGYVWPAGDTRGFPLYQFFSQQYGHYYTNYPNEINCQPHVYWDFQGEMARVNFPAPASQAFRQCRSFTFPGACDPFAKLRCEGRGQFFNPGNCQCSDGLP